MTIDDYLLVQARSIEDLEAKVKRMLADGWQPLGPPTHHDRQIVQALIKPTRKPYTTT